MGTFASVSLYDRGSTKPVSGRTVRVTSWPDGGPVETDPAVLTTDYYGATPEFTVAGVDVVRVSAGSSQVRVLVSVEKQLDAAPELPPTADDGQVLTWDASVGEWVARSGTSAGTVKSVNGVLPDASGDITLTGLEVKGIESLADPDGDGVATVTYTDGTTSSLPLPTSTVPGPANVLSVGTVTTGAAGTLASVTISGTSPSQTVDFIIPQGAQGDPGVTVPAVTSGTDPATSPLLGTDHFYVATDESSSGPGRIVGNGPPEGVVTADPGMVYVDEAITFGGLRWLKVEGTGSTGWICTHGDTGWRDIQTSLDFTKIVDDAYDWFWVRRVDQTVFLNIYIKPQNVAWREHGNVILLPTGMWPVASTTAYPRPGTTNEVGRYVNASSFDGSVDVGAGVGEASFDGTSYVNVTFEFSTRGPWLTSLPGAAV